MGTRADFYVGKNKTAEWIGSIAWDGYRHGIGDEVLHVTTEEDFRAAVARFSLDRDDVTLPSRGWPWPWKTSATSDCSYWFFDSMVWDDYGGKYWPADTLIDDEISSQREAIDFPVFDGSSAEAGSQRSGIMVIGI